jgi:chromosome segregation protein
MTAIVGPNGSGKSNILDAFRWVLGDSHASKLRISRQGDLLFQGSVSSPPSSEAEVCIQLREEVRVCVIRRRVSDSGSHLLVDGRRVAMSELDEVKNRWQLTGDRFAFIGQGDVTEVIQQRPQARRMLLESLFGIDAYRKRRDDASKSLANAKEDYVRLRTFSAELSSRREEIAPSAAKASAAQAIMDELDAKRRMLYWARRAGSSRALLAEEEERVRLKGALRVKEFWERGWGRLAAFLDGNLSELSQAKQNQIREVEEAKSSLSNFVRTAYGYGAALNSSRRRASQIGEERAAAAAKIEKLRKDKDALDKDGALLEKELDAGRKSLAEAELQHKEQREAAARDKENRDRINRARGELEGEMEALKGRIKSMGLALRNMNESDERENVLKDIKKELDSLEKRHVSLLDEQETAAAKHRDVYASLQDVSAKLQRSRRESSNISNRLSELQEQSQTEIYPKPVQHILSAARLGRLDAKPCAVIDAFTCSAEFASAIDSFLGARQFWILVETMDEAGRCIDQLKKSQAGRATFLPLERSRPRARDVSYKLPSNGIIGWAMDLVRGENHWSPALKHIMGDLLIVEDYPLGQKLAREGFRGPIATIGGEVFQPSGSISGGLSQKSGRAIEIKSAISRMGQDLRASMKLVDSLAAEMTSLEEEEAVKAKKKESLSEEIRELSLKRSALDARREEMTRERIRAKNERESMIASLRERALQYAEFVRRKKSLDEEIPDSSLEFDSGLLMKVEQLKSTVALAGERQRSAFVLTERTISDLRSAERSLLEMDDELSVCEQEIIANKSNLTRLARRFAEVVSRRRAVMAGLAEFGGRYELISSRRERGAARLDAAKAALKEAVSALSRCEYRVAELQRQIEELTQTWEEQYPYPGPDAASGLDPDDLRRAIRDRDRELKALGEFDLGALSEDRSLRERLAYLGGQLDDVGGGIIELERLIADADHQASLTFTEAMEEIDGKFNSLFKRLFGGGDARLDFIEGASLWESGVDVIARPPGKHPQSIAQLSGGEQSLSAIALLFASLDTAKSPIAILDEVDAALDEMNLRRFADLAKDAAGERQIFVMTHRRATMERADVLYGVTLAEPGLSQVIGVRVEDWA